MQLKQRRSKRFARLVNYLWTLRRSLALQPQRS